MTTTDAARPIITEAKNQCGFHGTWAEFDYDPTNLNVQSEASTAIGIAVGRSVDARLGRVTPGSLTDEV